MSDWMEFGRLGDWEELVRLDGISQTGRKFRLGEISLTGWNKSDFDEKSHCVEKFRFISESQGGKIRLNNSNNPNNKKSD